MGEGETKRKGNIAHMERFVGWQEIKREFKRIRDKIYTRRLRERKRGESVGEEKYRYRYERTSKTEPRREICGR